MAPHDQPSFWTRGTPYGCLASLLLTALLLFPLLFALAWGGAHCEPVPACQRAGERRFLLIMTIVVACSALVGLVVRRTVDQWPRLKPAPTAALIIVAVAVPAWGLAEILSYLRAW